MFKLGRQVESALMALKALNSGKGLSISEISQKHGLSKNTLSKVMQSLQGSGLLQSVQGTKGGYKLARPLCSMSFYDVLESLNEIKSLGCSSTHSPCDLAQTCNIQSPLMKWEAKFKNYLKQTSVQELVESNPQQEAHL